jgi:hypothetical protein
MGGILDDVEPDRMDGKSDRFIELIQNKYRYLPEAYRRFREDFSAEGKVDGLAGGAARGDGQRTPGSPGTPPPES